MNCGDERATGANHGLGCQIIGDFENICAGAEIMKLRVTTEQMRRVVAALTDAVSPPLRATRRLPFDFAVVTFAAGSRRSPGHPIVDFQRVPGSVAFQSFTAVIDTRDGFGV